MARTNKYASLNFNDIYEKKITTTTTNNKHHHPSTSPSPNKTKTILSNSRIHGNMLVLTRPSPKPIPISPPAPPYQQRPTTPDQTPPVPVPVPVPVPESDSISLRPLGKTGPGPSLSSIPSSLASPIQSKERDLSVSPRPNRFVPPHLRPGFAGREERQAPEVQKHFSGPRSREFANNRLGQGRHGEEGRPRSGGGNEMVRRGAELDPVEMSRPGSSGTRPGSSGIWYECIGTATGSKGCQEKMKDCALAEGRTH